MNTEIEVKILNIDVEAIKIKLDELGAKKVAERNMRRNIYSIIPGKKNPWIRLRDEGDKVTLAYKHVMDDGIDGTRESEIIVDDFDKTDIILNKLGFFKSLYQENKRISYILDGVEVELDFWPKIPAYIEIEGKSVEEVERVVKLLGFTLEQTTSINTRYVYEKHGIDIEKLKELKFD